MRFRRAAEEGIRAAGHDCLLMEHIASDDPPEVACAREVQTCDLFVLLIGISYGSCPEDGQKLSYTELEFRGSLASRRISRLVFTGDPEGYVIPLGVVQELARHGLPDQFERVERLKRSASSGCTPTFFATPEDLKARVQDSVERHFRDHPPDPGPTATWTIEGPLGELVPLLCDRTTQDIDFVIRLASATKSCPRSPFVTVLHGPRDQRHEACVRALIWRHLEKERATSGVIFQPSPLQRYFVEWPDSAGLILSMYKRLIGQLLLTVNKDADLSQLDAERFCEIASGVAAPYLVLRHPIRSWDGGVEQLIRKKYLPFWDEISRLSATDRWKSMPRILVFFEIEYDRGPDGAAPVELLKRIESVFQSGKRAAASPRAGDRCVTQVLEMLPDVKESDYVSWRSKYADVLPVAVRELNFAKEFGTKVVPMEKFEKHVRMLLGRV